MLKRLSGFAFAFLLTLLAASTVSAADCEFRFGFKTLRDLIPAIVGECLENERYAANGNSEQQTTGGLMVWRKADNWTAFTDGYRTWINGPNGLQQRLNTERFHVGAGLYPRRRSSADTNTIHRSLSFRQRRGAITRAP